MSWPTEFLIGFYMGYMMIAYYPRYKEGAKQFFKL